MGNPGSKLFEEDHQFSPYYMAGLAFYRLDSLFLNGTIDKKYKKVRFYILMLVPMIASTKDFPPLNSQKKCERFCAPIIDKLNDESVYPNIFLKAINVIDKSGSNVEDKQALKSKNMTDMILGAYDGEKI
ncbi:hypothetical protein [Motilimonas eburnea]|uniref:hypothetical protein n=1 Tax=Motilimonas eburnea TaxID=1737488 RepID=UPI001E38CD67|nr:hypothetical protein [Motilimonas eburnea]MCE2573079.1 hypothetical protein [Motilimonas eburnea]